MNAGTNRNVLLSVCLSGALTAVHLQNIFNFEISMYFFVFPYSILNPKPNAEICSTMEIRKHLSRFIY